MLSRVSAAAAAAAKHRTRALAALPKQQQLSFRSFSTEPAAAKRPKAIKVKKSDARRRVEPKPEVPPPQQQNALMETHDAPPPSPFVDQQQFQQQQPTFGQVMKAVRWVALRCDPSGWWMGRLTRVCCDQNFLFGIGMALAFSIVGGIIASMEEVRAQLWLTD